MTQVGGPLRWQVSQALKGPCDVHFTLTRSFWPEVDSPVCMVSGAPFLAQETLGLALHTLRRALLLLESPLPVPEVARWERTAWGWQSCELELELGSDKGAEVTP